MAKNIRHHGLSMAFAVATLFATQAASADTLDYTGPYFSPYDGGFTIQDSSPVLSPESVYAGGFSMKDTSGSTLAAGTTFEAWCVTIYNNLSSSTNYTRQGGGTFYSSATYKNTDLQRLASYVFDNSTTNFTKASWGAANVQSAAFQLGVWEIVNDSAGTGSYNVNSGDFKVTTGDSAALGLANMWLGVVNTGTYSIDQNLSVWTQDCTNNCTQNLAVFAPVPEPETYAMMLAGLGLIGFIARRRMAAEAV